MAMKKRSGKSGSLTRPARWPTNRDFGEASRVSRRSPKKESARRPRKAASTQSLIARAFAHSAKARGEAFAAAQRTVVSPKKRSPKKESARRPRKAASTQRLPKKRSPKKESARRPRKAASTQFLIARAFAHSAKARGEAFAAAQWTVVVRGKRKVVFEPRKQPPAWAWGVEREPAPLPDPSDVIFRGPRGRLLSKTELARVRAIYEVEKKYERALKEEKEYLAKKFPITPERTTELQNMLLRLKGKMTDANLDFGAVTGMDIAGHAMHGKVELHGIISVKSDETMAKEQLNDLVMAIVEQLRRQKIRRGLMVQLSFVPQEAVYLAYGRDGDLMTTAWSRVDKSSEIEAFVPAAQRMVAAMIRNGWDITSMRVSVFYDHTVSERGRVVSSGTTDRKKKR